MTTSEQRLNGKVVVVTGAGRGIGAATARLLAERAARLALGARSAPELRAVADSIGGDAAVLPTDVTRPGDVQALVDLAVERFGRVDVFVANAGVAVNAPLATGELDDWNQMIDVNLRGVLHGIAAALPLFQRQGVRPFRHGGVHVRAEMGAGAGCLRGYQGGGARAVRGPSAGDGGAGAAGHDDPSWVHGYRVYRLDP